MLIFLHLHVSKAQFPNMDLYYTLSTMKLITIQSPFFGCCAKFSLRYHNRDVLLRMKLRDKCVSLCPFWGCNAFVAHYDRHGSLTKSSRDTHDVISGVS